MTDRLVWIDCEMTGLDLQADALIEVAALVTDGELNVLGEGVDLVIRPTDEALAAMGDFVRAMHTNSGLLEELAGGTTLADAQEQVLAYVRDHVPVARKAPLAGNSVGTDRVFLARDMPELEAFLHYRNVDVSTIKELSRRWFPRALHLAPAKSGNHRALADIAESIEELRYYREAVFLPSPGPSPALLREIAARHQGALTGAGSAVSSGAGGGGFAGGVGSAAGDAEPGGEAGDPSGGVGAAGGLAASGEGVSGGVVAPAGSAGGARVDAGATAGSAGGA